MIHQRPEEQQFLNRTALFTEGNAWEASPLDALEHVFALDNTAALIDRWKRYSMAALRQTQNALDCAGCIDYFERVELLLETAYILHVKSRKELPFGKLFDVLSLGAWKKSLECWRNACMSNHSVIESVDPGFILVIYDDIPRLLEDGWQWYLANTDSSSTIEEAFPVYLLRRAA
ncbi:MAG: hypothetical protein QM664_09405 [Flavihumibacter sp.]